jgi:biotin carboxyl carrier protein
MPEYNISIGDQTYQITLIKKSEEGFFEAEINGRPIQLRLEAREDHPFTLNIRVDKDAFRIELEKPARNKPFSLRVNGKPFTGRLLEGRKKEQPRLSEERTGKVVDDSSKPRLKAGEIIAPMAGKIVSVKVKKGDNVHDGEVVCILEAMKMENEITATKTGVIEEVNITEGMPVNERDILIKIK